MMVISSTWGGWKPKLNLYWLHQRGAVRWWHCNFQWLSTWTTVSVNSLQQHGKTYGSLYKHQKDRNHVHWSRRTVFHWRYTNQKRKPFQISREYRYQRCSVNAELITRIQAVSYAYGRLRERVFDSHDLTLSTKLKVYIQCLTPLLTYGCETWTLYRYHIN